MAFIEGKSQPTWGDTLGSKISSGFQQIAQAKLQQMMDRQKQAEQARLYAQLPGMKPEWAQILAGTPEKDRAGLFRVLPMLEQMGGQQQPQQQMQGDASQGLPQDMQQPQQASSMQASPMQASQTQASSPFGAPTTPAQAYARAFEPPQIAAQREMEQYKQSQKKEASSLKYAQDTWKELDKKAETRGKVVESKKNLITDLNEVIALNSTGKLVQGKEHQALKALNLDKFFTNDVTQITAKDVERMGAGIASQFRSGGKMTNDIFNALKATLPSLINTQSGFDALARSVKLQTQLEVAYDKMRSQIENEYYHKKLPIPPASVIESEAESRLKPYEAKVNQSRAKIIGRAMVNANPMISEQLARFPEGTDKVLNGVHIRKVDGQWIPIFED
jgi:hypothetical protein